MPITFIDPTNIDLTTYFDSTALRVDCGTVTLPESDQSVICEVSSGAQVAFSIEFDHTDSGRTVTASHYDALGQLQTWSDTNPCSHDFGLTGGFVDVTVVATAASETRTTVIKIKVKPKTEKPFRG